MSGGVEMGLDKEVEKLEDREPANAANREVAAISRLVFEPRRFAMLNLLSGGGKADYPFLQRMTDLSMSALATHLRKMERGGLIEVRKEFVSRRPKTFVVISPEGKRALEDCFTRLKRARRHDVDTQASLFDGPQVAGASPQGGVA